MKCNIVRGDTSRHWRNTAIKARRALKTCLRLLTGSRGKTVYISVDGNLGMMASLLYAISARLGGAARLILHHHSRNHVNQKRPLMTMMAAVAGPKAMHVCICPSMAANLADQYPAVRRTGALSNVFSLADQATADPAAASKLRHITQVSGVWGICPSSVMPRGCARQWQRLKPFLRPDMPQR